MAKRAVFLDRDGVLNEDLGYVSRTEDLKIRSGVSAGLRDLGQAGFKLIVITNQSGIARGYFTAMDVANFHQALADEIFSQSKVRLDGFYICPHHPDGVIHEFTKDCDCRKPHPGMVLKAAEDHHINLAGSFFIGDKFDDIECAERSGVKGIQVIGRYPKTHPKALAIVENFQDAVSVILTR